MSETDINKSALKFMCGENTNICRFCIASTEKDEISLREFVTIKTPYYNDKLDYLTILHELRVSSEPALPEVLCLSCATLVVNSYLFQKLCAHSQQQWETSLGILEKNISQAESLKSRAASAYFIVEDDKHTMFTTFTPLSEKNKKNAIVAIKKSMKDKQKKIRSGKKKKQPSPCPHCDKMFTSLYNLENHKERMHYPKKIKCDSCSEMFSTEKQLRAHIDMHHVIVPCKVCGLELLSKYLLRLHKYKHYKNSCSQCEKQFVNLRTYLRHLKTCGETSKYICDLCGKAYSQKHSIQSHLNLEHGFDTVSSYLSCDWCDKKFKSKSMLKGHIVKHTRERNFTCEICGGKFVSNPALVYHRRLHTGERPYSCDMCDERFISASSRMMHKRRAHIGPEKHCDVCPAKFHSSNELNKHRRRHDNPRSSLYVGKINTKPAVRKGKTKVTVNYNEY